MSEPEILVAGGDDGVASVTLNRPQLHNAFNERVIAELTAGLVRLGGDERVRVVVVRANGASFSAGADLGWMKRMAGYDQEQNRADALALADLLHTLNTLPKPTIAMVQGAAYGGGVGLVAACDIAIAAESAVFCLSEVRLGLIPAVISPYVLAAIGQRAGRRWFLTAEKFTAAEALGAGLLHRVVPAVELEAAVAAMAGTLKEGGPKAQAAAKELIQAVADQPQSAGLRRDTAERIAACRASAEGREGIGAFLEKRLPAWRSGNQP
jgi:methylglutaconyl-CoA hydratase